MYKLVCISILSVLVPLYIYSGALDTFINEVQQYSTTNHKNVARNQDVARIYLIPDYPGYRGTVRCRTVQAPQASSRLFISLCFIDRRADCIGHMTYSREGKSTLFFFVILITDFRRIFM